MKQLLPLLFIFLIPGCRNERSHEVISRLAEHSTETDTASYPLFIDGRRRMVYQFGHISADKGLKLAIDTTSTPEETLLVVDALRQLSVE